jgi:DNA uptake protein ComE-like DNA-binding protein
MSRSVVNVALMVMVMSAGFAREGHAQVGTSQGIVDANSAPETELSTLPGMTPAIAKALVAKRPFMSAVELNTFLLAQGLTQEQAAAFYGTAFVHINLNTATSEEIMLVPNAGRRMAREFAEYRPWKTYAQFDKEIGKYVGAEATAKLAQYTFIPMDANTATDEALLTIPGANAALVARIKAGRPYKSAADLETAVAKGATPAEGKRVARYFAF